jgi:hypothetical protein
MSYANFKRMRDDAARATPAPEEVAALTLRGFCGAVERGEVSSDGYEPAMVAAFGYNETVDDVRQQEFDRIGAEVGLSGDQVRDSGLTLLQAKFAADQAVGGSPSQRREALRRLGVETPDNRPKKAAIPADDDDDSDDVDVVCAQTQSWLPKAAFMLSEGALALCVLCSDRLCKAAEHGWNGLTCVAHMAGMGMYRLHNANLNLLRKLNSEIHDLITLRPHHMVRVDYPTPEPV